MNTEVDIRREDIYNETLGCYVHTITFMPTPHFDGNDIRIYGYKLMTTIWQDFINAEKFGIDAIKSTYKSALNKWKNNYKHLTELVMVLNWRIFHTYQTNKEMAKLYEELYITADQYARTHLKGNELEYFYDTTD